VFGRTTEGLDVIDAIAKTPVGPGDRPLEDVVILGVDVTESGAQD
jgi:cyclophilin family peptidyl-prolyl cis-trans isomerase